MSHVRRATRIDARQGGVMRCSRPSDVMRGPVKLRPGRMSEPGTKIGPRVDTVPGECVMHGCTDQAMPDDGLCQKYRRKYRTHCDCGVRLTEQTYERTRQHSFCGECFRRIQLRHDRKAKGRA